MNKVLSRSEAIQAVKLDQEEGLKVVFTNGCFDLVHIGHKRYLQQAKECGDKLLIGVNTDASVRRLKGDERPIVSEELRAEFLTALTCVDYVVLFDEDTPLELITALSPNVLVKGGDYNLDTIVGADIVRATEGEVKVLSFVEGISTTTLYEKIWNLMNKSTWKQ